MKYCGECQFLCPTERKQTDKKESHLCLAYRRLLFHRGQHPRIPTPDYCTMSRGIKGFLNKFRDFINKWLW